MLLVDKIDELVTSLVLDSEVVSAVYDGTNTLITLENSYYGRVKMIVDIDGNSHEILISDQANNQITVASDLSTAQLVTFPGLHYFHGTVYATNNHIVNKKRDTKVPMAYLHEIIREKDRGKMGSSVEAPLRMFFLDQSNLADWNTNDHYSKVITGMKKVVTAFKDHLFDQPEVIDTDVEYTEVNHANFGIFRDMKGHEKRIFDDNLSGIELNFTIVIKKCNN